MPLTAAQTRTAIALQTTRFARPEVVPVKLKFDNINFISDNLVRALINSFGYPKVVDAQPSRNSYRLLFDAESNMVVNPNAAVSAATGFTEANGSTTTRTTVSAEKALGPSGFKVVASVTPNSGPQYGGITGVVLPVQRERIAAGLNPASKEYRATMLAKGNAGGEVLRFMIVEFDDAAGTNPQFANNTVTLTTSFARYEVVRSFTTGNFFRVIIDTNAGLAHTWFFGGLGFGPTGDLANLDSDALSPPTQASPLIVDLELVFDGGAVFDPLLMYDALDLTYATVATDNDTIGQQGDYQFTIT